MAFLTILQGSTFCISDERGDLAGETSGLYAHDTRFLSSFALRLDGARPHLLSSGAVHHFAASFYLRNPAVEGIPHDSLSISRERFVGTGLHERVAIRNETMETLASERSNVFRRGHMGVADACLGSNRESRARKAH